MNPEDAKGTEKRKRSKNTVCSEMLPWTCHRCKSKFTTENGGVCERCGELTCKEHFAENTQKESPGGVVCTECATGREKSSSSEKQA